MPSTKSVRILDAAGVDRALTRIAHEILERHKTLGSPALVGIRTRGMPLALRLADRLRELSGKEPPTGVLDINLYRDDLSSIADHPVLRSTEIPFDMDGARVVLVDDVLFTGRTIRAALDGLMDLGRPDWVQLAVLIDRGHREVPIRADYVGKNVPTSQDEQIDVRLNEVDGRDEVMLIRGKPPVAVERPEPAKSPARAAKKKAGPKTTRKKKAGKSSRKKTSGAKGGRR